MNKVALLGRLTKDVELRGEDDHAFARFTVAVNRSFKNKETGEYDTDFIGCKAFGKTAEFIEKYFGKGDMIGITGNIQTGSYENKKGDTVYTTDIFVETADFTGGKNNKNSDDEDYEKPKKKRKPEPEDEDYDNDYPF